MKTYKIALASLSTSMVGCADPIVGNWDGKTLIRAGQQSDLPYEYCYDDSSSTEEGESCNTVDFYIDIENDLSGTIDMSLLGVATKFSMLPLESSEGYKYSVPILGDTIEIYCTLTSAVLVCGFEDQFSVEFEKIQ